MDKKKGIIIEDTSLDSDMSKFGDYDNPKDGCPNCGRYRIMLGDDKKHRCEKCGWCIEDEDYDTSIMH